MVTTIHKGLDKKVSRLELLVRIPYLMAVYIVLFVYSLLVGLWGIWASLCCAVHWLYILILGKRHSLLNEQVTKFVNFAYGRLVYDYLIKKVLPYEFLLTDKRPGFSI